MFVKEIELKNTNSPPKKPPGPDVLTRKFCQTFKEEIIIIKKYRNPFRSHRGTHFMKP